MKKDKIWETYVSANIIKESAEVRRKPGRDWGDPNWPPAWGEFEKEIDGMGVQSLLRLTNIMLDNSDDWDQLNMHGPHPAPKPFASGFAKHTEYHLKEIIKVLHSTYSSHPDHNPLSRRRGYADQHSVDTSDVPVPNKSIKVPNWLRKLGGK